MDPRGQGGSAEQEALAREEEAKDAEQHGPVPRAHCCVEMTYRETRVHMYSFILATTNWGAHNLKVKWMAKSTCCSYRGPEFDS